MGRELITLQVGTLGSSQLSSSGASPFAPLVLTLLSSTGQAGNAIGSEFWYIFTSQKEPQLTVCRREKILAEHGLNQDGHVGGGVTQEQTAGLNVFFSKAENQKYVPRCLTVDLEPSTMDAFKGGKVRGRCS